MRSHGEVLLTDVIEHTVIQHLQERVQRDGLDLHKHYGLPLPNPEIINQAAIPAVIREETHFDIQSLQDQITNRLPCLNSQQRDAFDKVIDSVTNGDYVLFECQWWHWQDVRRQHDFGEGAVNAENCPSDSNVRHCCDVAGQWPHLAFATEDPTRHERGVGV